MMGEFIVAAAEMGFIAQFSEEHVQMRASTSTKNTRRKDDGGWAAVGNEKTPFFLF